jgi:hypothetical protein
VNCYSVSPHGFFLWFFPKWSFSILFFNIELIKNYSYNMWGKHCNFPRKLLWITTVFFSTWVFFYFLCFFKKIIFVNFIFKILSWLRITITSKAKSCGENTITFLTKHYRLIQFFLTKFFFQFFLCFFFVILFSKIIFVDFIF